MLLTYPLTPDTAHTTRIIEAGEPGRHLVFFVHGLAARAERWIRNLEVVGSAGYHAVAVDVPGHGFASREASVPVAVEGVVDELDTVLETLLREHRPAALSFVGSSIGAVYCAYLAQRHLDATTSLHLAAPLALEPLGEDGRRGLAQRLRVQSPEAVRKKVVALGLDDPTMVEQWFREELAANGSSVGIGYLSRLADQLAATLDDHVIMDRLQTIERDVAIHLYWGAKDAVVDVEIGRRASRQLRCPLTVFDRSGHAAYLSEHDAFNEALLRDLSSSARS